MTTDMISWEQLPAALAPDQDYDRDGCFSGSAIEADNKHALVYTGVTKITLPDGRKRNDRTSASHSGMAEGLCKV